MELSAIIANQKKIKHVNFVIILYAVINVLKKNVLYAIKVVVRV
jgi:hypothetical protein